MYKCINGVVSEMTEDEIRAFEAAVSDTPPEQPSQQTPDVNEQAVTLARAMASTATNLTDAVALSIPDLLPTWEELLVAGAEIAAGVCLTHGGQTYRVVQAVTPQAHQPPGGDGMLAVYRPIDREHTGTADDPIPWVYGMDCYAGKYYSCEGKSYLAKLDMLPCVWTPGSAGTSTVWEEVV